MPLLMNTEVLHTNHTRDTLTGFAVGFNMIESTPRLEDLPPKQSTIHVLWVEDNGELKGWHRATVEHYSPGSTAQHTFAIQQ